MSKTLVTLMLTAAAMAAGCKTGNAGNTGQSAAGIGEVPANSFRVQWKRNLEMKEARPREMYVRGDSLFVYDTRNIIYDLNRTSGTVKFISDTVKPGAPVKPPLVTKDYVVIPTDTRLDFLDKRGFVDKSIDLKSPIRSGVVSDELTFYVGINAADGSGRLMAIDPSRPYTAKWEVRTGGPLLGTPAFAFGAVYAGSQDGKVYAVAPDKSGAWLIGHGAFESGGPITTDIFAEKSGVYVASGDSRLYCLDPRDGKIRWQYYAGTALYDSPVVTATTVYLKVRDRGIVAVNKTEGDAYRKAKWAVADAAKFLAEDEKYVILLGDDNVIMAVDKNTGKFKFASKRNDFVATAVNPIDGIAYAATESGEVVAGVAVSKYGSVGEIVWARPEELPTMLASR